MTNDCLKIIKRNIDDIDFYDNFRDDKEEDPEDILYFVEYDDTDVIVATKNINDEVITIPYIINGIECDSLLIDNHFKNVRYLIIEEGIKNIYYDHKSLGYEYECEEMELCDYKKNLYNLNMRRIDLPESFNSTNIIKKYEKWFPHLELLVIKSKSAKQEYICGCNFIVCHRYNDKYGLSRFKKNVWSYNNVKDSDITYIDDVYYLRCLGYYIAIKANNDAKTIVLKDHIDEMPVTTIGTNTFAGSSAINLVIPNTVSKIYDDLSFIRNVVLLGENNLDTKYYDAVCYSLDEAYDYFNNHKFEIEEYRDIQRIPAQYVDTSNDYTFEPHIQKMIDDPTLKSDILANPDYFRDKEKLGRFSYDDNGTTYYYDVYEYNNEYYGIIRCIACYHNSNCLIIPSYINGIKIIAVARKNNNQCYLTCEKVTDIYLGDNILYFENPVDLGRFHKHDIMPNLTNIWIGSKFDCSLNALCTTLKSFKYDYKYIVSKANKYFESHNGALYTKNMKALIKGKFYFKTIPNGVEVLCSYSVDNFSYLPESIRQLNDDSYSVDPSYKKQITIYGKNTINLSDCIENEKIEKKRYRPKNSGYVELNPNMEYIHPDAIITGEYNSIQIVFEEMNKHYITLDDIVNQTIPEKEINNKDVKVNILNDLPNTTKQITQNDDTTYVDLFDDKYKNISELFIEKDVEYIFTAPFVKCNLEKIDVDKDNKYYGSIDGILYNKDLTEIIYYPPMKKDEIYEVLDSIKSVSIDSFIFNRYLKKVILNNKINKYDEDFVKQNEKYVNSKYSSFVVLNHFDEKYGNNKTIFEIIKSKNFGNVSRYKDNGTNGIPIIKNANVSDFKADFLISSRSSNKDFNVSIEAVLDKLIFKCDCNKIDIASNDLCCHEKCALVYLIKKTF